MLKRYLLPVALLLSGAVHAQEICNNGVDDDGDGLIDLNDTTDCRCNAVISGGVPSYIPNPGFEHNDCEPTSYGELNCAETWEQATWATSDYFIAPYYMPTDVVPQPLPDGNACAGLIAMQGYAEYLGACLLSPMTAGTEYSLSMWVAGGSENGSLSANNGAFYGPLDITIFGNTACVPFPVPTNTCPEPEGWIALGATSYQADNTWQQVTITFTPSVDIESIMIGPPCDIPADFVWANGYDPYFWFDGLTLNESILFGGTISPQGSICNDNLVLNGNPDALATNFQWYHEGVALVGQTDSLLQVSALGLDTGNYQFQAAVDTACVVSVFHVDAPIYPEPLFTAVPHQGCAPLAVSFTNTTDPALVDTMEWYFGDGDSTAVNNPTHTYTQGGTYTVSMRVTSDQGCATDTSFSDIADLITAYSLPVAEFTSDVQEICAGESVTFTNTTDSLTSSCAWTFGDGGTSTDCNPTHIYATPGLQDVRLTVTTAHGCVDDTLRVHFINVHDDPAVNFTAEPTEGCVPWTVQFTNTTPAAQVDSVFWQFGQGDSSYAAAPSSTYLLPGVYDVRLSVTDNVGCTSDTTIVAMVTTHGHPVPSFTFSPDSGCYPLDVSFVNTTDPSFNATCHWDFGDGGTSDICDTAHIYTDPGLYTVTLSTISEFGCDGDTTMADIITVFDHPTAGFTFGPQPTDVFQTEQVFTNTSSSDAITWSWAFDRADPDSSSIPDPVVLFPGGDPGQYPVQLIVSNEHTCTDTATAIVIINGYFSVYAPNAFTPDGDGVNEGWRPIWKDLDESSYQLSVYDRWGRQVWSSTDAFMSWDGKLDGHDPKPDVYVWRLAAKDDISHKGHEFLGHVTVLR